MNHRKYLLFFIKFTNLSNDILILPDVLLAERLLFDFCCSHLPVSTDRVNHLNLNLMFFPSSHSLNSSSELISLPLVTFRSLFEYLKLNSIQKHWLDCIGLYLLFFMIKINIATYCDVCEFWWIFSISFHTWRFFSASILRLQIFYSCQRCT